jgi:hypothetical protein
MIPSREESGRQMKKQKDQPRSGASRLGKGFFICLPGKIRGYEI